MDLPPLMDLGECVCGRKIYSTEDPAGVVHEMPTCENFDKMEPIQFMRYVRMHRGISDN